MKNSMTAKEAREMANSNQNQFVNTRAMKRVLRFIKKKASQGYYSGVIEVFKYEVELIRANLEKLGYKTTISQDNINEYFYIDIAW